MSDVGGALGLMREAEQSLRARLEEGIPAHLIGVEVESGVRYIAGEFAEAGNVALAVKLYLIGVASEIYSAGYGHGHRDACNALGVQRGARGQYAKATKWVGGGR